MISAKETYPVGRWVFDIRGSNPTFRAATQVEVRCLNELSVVRDASDMQGSLFAHYRGLCSDSPRFRRETGPP